MIYFKTLNYYNTPKANSIFLPLLDHNLSKPEITNNEKLSFTSLQEKMKGINLSQDVSLEINMDQQNSSAKNQSPKNTFTFEFRKKTDNPCEVYVDNNGDKFWAELYLEKIDTKENINEDQIKV